MDTLKSLRQDVLEIKIGGKTRSIDITKELEINVNTLNSQLLDIPSNYDFLTLLRDEALKKFTKLKRDRDTTYSQLWVYYKEAGGTNDMAANKAASNKKYLSIEKDCRKAEAKYQRLNSICRSYESREQILRTLSANNRQKI
jgi:hypothetical protein